MSDEPSGGSPDDSADESSDGSPPRRGWLAGRHSSAAVIGVLTLLLGFAIAVQVHANAGGDALSGLREDDLISILDDQDDRAQRLRAQIAQLRHSLAGLRHSDNRSAAARRQATKESAALGVLLGTVPAHGPGVVVTVADPHADLAPEDLLDVVEELRGAGAEAIEFGGVRVGTDTAFTGSAGSVRVDGTAVSSPYRVLAIGPAKTMDTALSIPGGAAATIRSEGGQVHTDEQSRVLVTATRALPDDHDEHPGG
ncbi:DUF881 domain-containing protein [Jatrophihabitans endophyticus]|uniref:DUF881 domain-containing protein n=1 Tax=Jatrophihabitans endophyticus TaxID=1206085 RepID=UPI0019ED06E6|nr:DUF881 domain-containing protein [Jatrophihabitans endophyticus]MBE7186756.1 DUF881 domain-containing protein [Jatrophihabitans endophyticus]